MLGGGFAPILKINIIIQLKMVGKRLRGSKDKTLWVWIDSSCYAFNEHGVMYCINVYYL